MMKSYKWLDKLYGRRITAIDNTTNKSFVFYVTQDILDQLSIQVTAWETTHGELPTPHTMSEIIDVWNGTATLKTLSCGNCPTYSVTQIGRKITK